MISIEQLSVYSKIFLISSCKKFVIPLVVGLHYIFYAHRSVMFTVDRANQWESKQWYVIYTVGRGPDIHTGGGWHFWGRISLGISCMQMLGFFHWLLAVQPVARLLCSLVIIRFCSVLWCYLLGDVASSV